MLISVNSAPNVANYPHGAPGIDAGAINTGMYTLKFLIVTTQTQ